MTEQTDRVPAPLLVLAAIVSVQFGAALATTLIASIGVAGSVTLRLVFAAAVLLVVVRPSLRGHSRSALLTVAGFGLTLAAMNVFFYSSLARLPIGVAVTIEFLGPLVLAAALSRRVADLLAVLAAGLGVALISGIVDTPWEQVRWDGLAFGFGAAVMWATYIVMSGRTGRAFPALDGLAMAMTVAALVVAPFGFGTVGGWHAGTLAAGLGIALLSSVVPYSLELLALRRMSARVFGVIMSLEPAVAALAGLAVLGQRLSGLQVLGMALVMLASALVLGLGAARPADPAVTDLGG